MASRHGLSRRDPFSPQPAIHRNCRQIHHHISMVRGLLPLLQFHSPFIIASFTTSVNPSLAHSLQFPAGNSISPPRPQPTNNGFDIKFWDPTQLPVFRCSSEIAFTIEEMSSSLPLGVTTKLSLSESNHETYFNYSTINAIPNPNCKQQTKSKYKQHCKHFWGTPH